MIPRRLALITLGRSASDPDLPRWLAGELAGELRIDVERGPALPLQQRWRDHDTGRLSSNAIVDDLAPRAHGWTLVLADHELAGPGGERVFGEGTLGGPLALVGLASLRSEDRHLFRLRALKEALHELGHLAGLPHCPDRRCVMSPSVTIRDVDMKLAGFCAACRARIGLPLPP